MARTPPLALIGVVTILGFSSLACGLGDKIQEKAGEAVAEKLIEAGAPGLDVDLSGSGSSVDLTGLPETLRYPGATAVGKFAASSGDGAGGMYMLQSDASKQQVVDWYKHALSGFQQQATMETGEGVMLIYSTADESQSATVTIAPEDGKTSISILYAYKTAQ